MDCMRSSPINGFCRVNVHKTKDGHYINSYGEDVIILTPLRPVQSHKEDKELEEYLSQHRDKIANGRWISYGTPISDGHIAYEVLDY